VPGGYPILLDVRDKKIVIVGGGPVGLRKAQKLIEAGAGDVTVVSPSFVEGFDASVTKVREAFRPEHLAGADLVFAATDSPQVNGQIVAEARRRKVWVSRADAEETADFSTPAVLREGPVTVAVSAESAALSAFIRDGVRDRWEKRWSDMAEAMRTLRPFIVGSGLSPEKRRELFRRLATEAALEKLARGGLDGLREWIKAEMNA
jgi:precorrin-2 dehydrogenase / sirohydrochlorin ferrochelatase